MPFTDGHAFEIGALQDESKARSAELSTMSAMYLRSSASPQGLRALRRTFLVSAGAFPPLAAMTVMSHGGVIGPLTVVDTCVAGAAALLWARRVAHPTL